MEKRKSGGEEKGTLPLRAQEERLIMQEHKR